MSTSRLQRQRTHWVCCCRHYSSLKVLRCFESGSPQVFSLQACRCDVSWRAEAEPLFRSALKVYSKQLGPDHPATQAVTGGLHALEDSLGLPQSTVAVNTAAADAAVPALEDQDQKSQHEQQQQQSEHDEKSLRQAVEEPVIVLHAANSVVDVKTETSASSDDHAAAPAQALTNSNLSEALGY